MSLIFMLIPNLQIYEQKKFTFLLHLQNVYESIKMLNQKILLVGQKSIFLEF